MNMTKTFVTLIHAILIAMFTLVPAISVYAQDNEMRREIMSANTSKEIQKLADRYKERGLGEERVLGEMYKEFADAEEKVAYLFGAGYCGYINYEATRFLKYKGDAEKYLQKVLDKEWNLKGEFTSKVRELDAEARKEGIEYNLTYPRASNGNNGKRNFRNIIIIATLVTIVLFIQFILRIRKRKKA